MQTRKYWPHYVDGYSYRQEASVALLVLYYVDAYSYRQEASVYFESYDKTENHIGLSPSQMKYY